MNAKCPGQDKRKLSSEIVKCPRCSYKIEFFSDEIKLICPACKTRVYRAKLPSCMDWCKMSKQCRSNI